MFIFSAKVLNRGLSNLLLQKRTGTFYTPSHCPVISHLAFADDIVIFTNGSKTSFQQLMNFSTFMKKNQGNLLAKQKAFFVVGDTTCEEMYRIIEEITGFQKKKNLPIK